MSNNSGFMPAQPSSRKGAATPQKQQTGSHRGVPPQPKAPAPEQANPETIEIGEPVAKKVIPTRAHDMARIERRLAARKKLAEG